MTVKLKLTIDTTDVNTVEDISDVHYRIIWREDIAQGRVACVQNFDYYDYKEFIGNVCFELESDAEDALALMNAVGIQYFRNNMEQDVPVESSPRWA